MRGIPRDPSLAIDDPNEQFNRHVLAANQVVLDPVANVVKSATPGPVLNRLRDFDDNLKEPRIFANDVLQGRFGAASLTFGRFVFNSTFGLGGLFDVATQGGLPKQSGDVGQTLFVWGVPAGPFVERPYFGPSTLRNSLADSGFGGRPSRLDAGLGFRVAVNNWPERAGGRGASRPMEGSRERLDRLLQLLALGLLPDPTGRAPRGARSARRRRVAGHPRA